MTSARAGLELQDAALSLDGRELLRATTLHVPSGSSLVVTGGAGSGKSRVLEALAGLRPPTGGRIVLDGAAPEPGVAGIVTQRHELLGGLTSAENVALRSMRDGGRGPTPTEIDELLASLGLPEPSWHNLVEQLSGGQQQRVAIARALVGEPALLCLDDPTSELDESTAALVRQRIRQATLAGAVVVVASDDAADRVLADVVLDLRG